MTFYIIFVVNDTGAQSLFVSLPLEYLFFNGSRLLIGLKIIVEHHPFKLSKSEGNKPIAVGKQSMVSSDHLAKHEPLLDHH